MAYIDVIQYDESEGRLREIYDHLIQTRGKLAEVHKIQSLHPESIMNHMDLYVTIMFGRSPLKRVKREMMAVVVSAANECEYCQVHHAEAVAHYWKDEGKVAQLKRDYRKVDLSDEDRAFCDLAWKMTRETIDIQDDLHLRPLRELEVNDRAILDAMLVISYFNFVNRMVLGLGINLEGNPGGYNYD